MSDALAFLRQSAAYNDRISVPRIYMRMVEDVSAGVMLAQLVYWFEPGKDGNTRATVERDGRLWLVKRWEDWDEDCCMSVGEARRACAHLEARGLVMRKVWKSPLYGGNTTVHLSINWEIFLEIFQTRLLKPAIPGIAENSNRDRPIQQSFITGTTSQVLQQVEKKPGVDAPPRPVRRGGNFLDIDTMVSFLDKPKYRPINCGAVRENLRVWLEVCESEGNPASAAFLTLHLGELLKMGANRATAALINSAHKRLKYIAEPFTNGNGKKYTGIPTVLDDGVPKCTTDGHGNLNPGWCYVKDDSSPSGVTNRRLDSLNPGDVPLDDDLKEMRL